MRRRQREVRHVDGAALPEQLIGCDPRRPAFRRERADEERKAGIIEDADVRQIDRRAPGEHIVVERNLAIAVRSMPSIEVRACGGRKIEPREVVEAVSRAANDRDRSNNGCQQPAAAEELERVLIVISLAVKERQVNLLLDIGLRTRQGHEPACVTQIDVVQVLPVFRPAVADRGCIDHRVRAIVVHCERRGTGGAFPAQSQDIEASYSGGTVRGDVPVREANRTVGSRGSPRRNGKGVAEIADPVGIVIVAILPRHQDRRRNNEAAVFLVKPANPGRGHKDRVISGERAGVDVDVHPILAISNSVVDKDLEAIGTARLLHRLRIIADE